MVGIIARFSVSLAASGPRYPMMSSSRIISAFTKISGTTDPHEHSDAIVPSVS